MYTHNLDPVLVDFGLIAIRWYSLAYIFGIIIGWWLGKKIIVHILQQINLKFNIKELPSFKISLFNSKISENIKSSNTLDKSVNFKTA